MPLSPRVLRNQKEFGSGNKVDAAKIVLENFDTAALLQRRQEQQVVHENCDEDQPVLIDNPNVKSKPKLPSLTPLVQLAKPSPSSPFVPLAHPPLPAAFVPDPNKTAKQNRNALQRWRWRRKRKSARLAAQRMAGTTLKGCAARKVARTLLDKKKHILIGQDLATNLEARKGGSWTGRKVERDGKTYTLQQVLDTPGMRLVHWDGSETLLVDDSKTRHVVTCLEIPDDPSWFKDLNNFVELIDWAEEEIRERKGDCEGRRGKYASIPTGISFGGGQTQPGNFSQTAVEQEVWAKVYAHPFYQRALRYAQHGMKSYHSKLERLYSNVKQGLRVDNPNLVDPLPGCCFSACNLNMGRAVTLRHTDFLNLLFGQCAVLPLGHFDYEAGGHLVLWDLGLVIEFPPGSMILLPSALIEHSNVSIAGNERRSSITFYSASGLFRWVTNGYMSDKEFKDRAGTKMRQRWDQHRADLWKVGLELLSR
ncbi:hypothetical protein AAF712_013776 [Marasmius tenuissimus]|uniref:Uncharacterized protein n=1 Tax=Marasmius tenuissimus TaxID=585030 RepID=A0ABR2ZDR6_9AGAR